jgi:hypothetical protein
MPKRYITVQLEVDWDDEETLEVYSVLPVSVDASTLPPEELRAVHEFLRTDDDADFDLMWDLRHLLSEARSDAETNG